MQIKICLYLALAPRAYPKGQRNKPYMAVVLVTLQYEQILLMQLGRGTIYLHQFVDLSVHLERQNRADFRNGANEIKSNNIGQV